MTLSHPTSKRVGLKLDRWGRLRLCTLSLGAMFFATGCVVGHWELEKVEPQAARRDVTFQSFTLQRDGSFYAEAEDEGIHTKSGTYTYKDGVLDFKTHDGTRYTYDAELVGAKLHLERFWEGQKLELDYAKRD